MKKILVIGGSGFLGSHVADFLTEMGHEVTIFDLKKSPWLKKNQNFILGNILDENLIDEVVKNHDVVYLFASIADIDEALHKPVETVEVNILGPVKILSACVRHKIERFNFASSVYVYSREGGFYRCSKQAVENYIEEYHRLYGLDYTIFRYGSLYGPRADKGNGLMNILKNGYKDGYISYIGNPNSEREYIHIFDAAKASCLAVGEDFKNESIILTGHERIIMKNLLLMIKEIFNYNTDIKFSEENYEGHYVKTPYAYQPKLGKKYIPTLHVDLGQGILKLLEEIKSVVK